jgi:alkylhydroperoxidase/carboxymuconolactone decarboxylase family protein YurZ
MINQEKNKVEKELKRINAIFYEKDKFNKPGQFIQRQFKNPWHFIHNLFELFSYTPDLIRVYFSKTISPRFRELIMLTVASTNNCHL